MKPQVVFIYVLLLWACQSEGNSQRTAKTTASTSFDQYFHLQSFDTLHVHSVGFNQTFSKEISFETLKKENVPLDSGTYQAVSRFFMSADKNLTGYLFRELTGSATHQVIHLCIRSEKLKRFIFHIEVASWTAIENTMEQTLNSWILDVNGDGVLDVATKKYLEDFELPTEDAPNISGEEKYIHVFQKGAFEYRAWPVEL